MANPGPNIVAESLQRGEAVVQATVGTSSMNNSTVAAFTATVNGVVTTDHVTVSANTGNATYAVSAYVSAANTVTVVYANFSGGALTPGTTALLRITRPYPAASLTTDFGVTKPLNAGPIPLST